MTNFRPFSRKHFRHWPFAIGRRVRCSASRRRDHARQERAPTALSASTTWAVSRGRAYASSLYAQRPESHIHVLVEVCAHRPGIHVVRSDGSGTYSPETQLQGLAGAPV
jgi:hypothetical protein